MFDRDLLEQVDPEFAEWAARRDSYGNGRSSSECRRGCCWTPFGHSPARDASRGCRCHGSVGVAG